MNQRMPGAAVTFLSIDESMPGLVGSTERVNDSRKDKEKTDLPLTGPFIPRHVNRANANENPTPSDRVTIRMSERNLVLLALILVFLTHPALGQDSKSQPSDKTLRDSKSADFNRNIYYKNKLEFSLETGWLPNNIPLVFDFLVGSPYTTWPLHYTLVPNIASLRWQLDDVGGPLILRGNWDFTFSGSFTVIPRGPGTRQ